MCVCPSVAECTREPGLWGERQSPAATNWAGRQRAGSEGLCQAFSDSSGERVQTWMRITNLKSNKNTCSHLIHVWRDHHRCSTKRPRHFSTIGTTLKMVASCWTTIGISGFTFVKPSISQLFMENRWHLLWHSSVLQILTGRCVSISAGTVRANTTGRVPGSDQTYPQWHQFDGHQPASRDMMPLIKKKKQNCLQFHSPFSLSVTGPCNVMTHPHPRPFQAPSSPQLLWKSSEGQGPTSCEELRAFCVYIESLDTDRIMKKNTTKTM